MKKSRNYQFYIIASDMFQLTGWLVQASVTSKRYEARYELFKEVEERRKRDYKLTGVYRFYRIVSKNELTKKYKKDILRKSEVDPMFNEYVYDEVR